jgi:hypothetical protein
VSVAYRRVALIDGMKTQRKQTRRQDIHDRFPRNARILVNQIHRTFADLTVKFAFLNNEFKMALANDSHSFQQFEWPTGFGKP